MTGREMSKDVAGMNSGSSRDDSSTDNSRFNQLAVQLQEDTVDSTKLVKLPPFWKNYPVLWFIQVESTFALSRITSDEVKYRCIIQNLEPAVMPFVSDLLMNPPFVNRYETIKQKIISLFEETDECRLRKLLQGYELGKEKPSHFLQRLKDLAGVRCSDAVVRILFLEHLPDNVRKILAISEVTNLSKLGLQADKIIEISNANVSQIISSDQRKENNNDSMSEFSELREAVEAIAAELNELKHRPHCARQRSSSRDRYSKRRVPKSPRPKAKICYYHKKFGNRAFRCLLPCAYKLQAEN
ncbi:uncharacterized protein LOC116853960 [Odontomachus brunneus]|uniref:uncharacterized protein LOC116853960 n=1 Tax=Odontomachus brunneus TaxID=486640 RepID=UPI0013F1B4C4|nr:uncharacterized protein LOC116853960 [Odontomachus brunneus]